MVQQGAASGSKQMVIVLLNGEEYAAPIVQVNEIIPITPITPIPNAPSYISGLISVRGQVATVVNLGDCFGLSCKSQGGYIILTLVNKRLLGIIVDEVRTVELIADAHILPTSGLIEIGHRGKYIKEVATLNDRIVLILDVHKLVTELVASLGV